MSSTHPPCSPPTNCVLHPPFQCSPPIPSMLLTHPPCLHLPSVFSNHPPSALHLYHPRSPYHSCSPPTLPATHLQSLLPDYHPCSSIHPPYWPAIPSMLPTHHSCSPPTILAPHPPSLLFTIPAPHLLSMFPNPPSLLASYTIYAPHLPSFLSTHPPCFPPFPLPTYHPWSPSTIPGLVKQKKTTLDLHFLDQMLVTLNHLNF